MNSVTIPIILTIAAIIAAFSAYQGVRRGGSRYYALERESMLRRASYTMIGSMFLFLAAIVLLIYSYQQQIELSQANGVTGEITAPESGESGVQTQPPTATVTPTVDPSIPTPTLTPAVCRAIVDGTAGGGLTLRDAPSGAEVEILPDGTILTLLDSESVEANTFTWLNVRTIGQKEGWVVDEFLKVGDCR